MSLAIQQPLPGIELPRHPSASQLLQLALEKESGIEIIERITALMERERDYQARVDFDTALNNCQAQIGRIAPNQKRENGIMWADYAQLDRTLRPIYIPAGFSIGFSEVESSDKGRLRMCATLSMRGVSREYFADISRAPANGKMNQLDADASAASRVKRYLMLDIFNIAIGIDKDEKLAVPEASISEDQEAKLQEWADALNECPDLNTLKNVFADAYKYAKSVGDKPKAAMSRTYEECKRRFL